MANQFGWAYVGVGSIAQNTSKAILASGNHKIVANYNRTFSKAEEFAKKVGSKAFPTLKEALQCEGVEGVYIGTTNDNHYDMAKACIDLGVPVLLEKPFTVNKAEAVRLIDYAKEKNVYIAEAMWTWYSPIALKVKEWIDSGAIGKVKYAYLAFEGSLFKEEGYTGLERHMNPKQAGGTLLDMGVYNVAYAYKLFGMPESVDCFGKLRDGVDIDETIIMCHKDGVNSVSRVSFVAPEFNADSKIVGTKGEINIPKFFATNSVTLSNERGVQGFEQNGDYDVQFTKVGEEIRAGLKESKCWTFQETLDIMGIMDDCRKQMGLKYPIE